MNARSIGDIGSSVASGLLIDDLAKPREPLLCVARHPTEDLGTGKTHRLAPGVMYALNAHDHHIVRPKADIVTACVFNPPVTGREVHDENGAYPAEADMPPREVALSP